MKIIKMLFVIGVFTIIGIPEVQALRIFGYDMDLQEYSCVSSGGTNNLNDRYNDIQSYNSCYIGSNHALYEKGSNYGGKKNTCEAAGGTWVYTTANSPYYGECRIFNRVDCENKGGTFYPALVTTDNVINIDTDTTINYMLVAYNAAININAKVTFSGDGAITGTIGEYGKIVISDTGKVEYADLSKKLYGNTSEYDISVGTGSLLTYKSLAPNGEPFPKGSYDGEVIPGFLNSISTISDYMELEGDFKLNNPFTLINYPSSYGSRILLNDNSTLDLLSDLTIDSGSKITTGLNSKLSNSATLTVNGNLYIKGAFNNGYKYNTTNELTPTNTGTTIVGPTGKITLYDVATGNNNSENDIPVTLESKDATTPPIESVIPSNRPKIITINSDITNGVVSVSKSSAARGETITLTIAPSTGYRIKSIKILKSDNTDVTSLVNYNTTNNTFTMPNYNVKISAVFEEIKNSYFEESDYSYFEESEEQTYNINEDDKLEFRLKPDYNMFKNGGKVYVDDELVDQKYITSKSGSTIIILAKEYLDKLSPGNHTLKVTFNTDVSTETMFTISREETNPKTEDEIMSVIYIGSISLVGLFGTSIFLKKKRFN